jgi:tetratricopeptide (TPR) repeat protein
VELDPLNPRRLVILGQQYYWMRRFEDAIAAFREAARAGAVDTHGMMAYALLLAGRPEEAVLEAQKGVEDPKSQHWLAQGDLAAILAYTGHTEPAREILAEWASASGEHVPTGAVAWIEMALGHWDQAFDAYARVREEGSILSVPDVRIDPLLDPLRRDPRYPALLRSFNFPPDSSPSSETPQSAKG